MQDLRTNQRDIASANEADISSGLSPFLSCEWQVTERVLKGEFKKEARACSQRIHCSAQHLGEPKGMATCPIMCRVACSIAVGTRRLGDNCNMRPVSDPCVDNDVTGHGKKY